MWNTHTSDVKNRGYLASWILAWNQVTKMTRRALSKGAAPGALWPGLCLTIVVYCLNMFGDAVRDLLDPRLRGGGGRLGADRGASV